jgi:hypothetical protein
MYITFKTCGDILLMKGDGICKLRIEYYFFLNKKAYPEMKKRKYYK